MLYIWLCATLYIKKKGDWNFGKSQKKMNEGTKCPHSSLEIGTDSRFV